MQNPRSIHSNRYFHCDGQIDVHSLSLIFPSPSIFPLRWIDWRSFPIFDYPLPSIFPLRWIDCRLFPIYDLSILIDISIVMGRLTFISYLWSILHHWYSRHPGQIDVHSLSLTILHHPYFHCDRQIDVHFLSLIYCSSSIFPLRWIDWRSFPIYDLSFTIDIPDTPGRWTFIRNLRSSPPHRSAFVAGKWKRLKNKKSIQNCFFFISSHAKIGYNRYIR